MRFLRFAPESLRRSASTCADAGASDPPAPCCLRTLSRESGLPTLLSSTHEFKMRLLKLIRSVTCLLTSFVLTECLLESLKSLLECLLDCLLEFLRVS